MAVRGNIQYILQKDIDKIKWDACIDRSSNGLLYGYSIYLDHMAKHWDALVLGDYQAVMPLTYNKKYGIYYLYQPPFVAAGGIFGEMIDLAMVNDFIESIPAKFKLIEISLNPGNPVPDRDAIMRNNFILNLDKPYEEIRANYRENIVRNIRKSQQAGCSVKTHIPVSDIITIHKEQLKNLIRVSDRDYENFKRLYERLQTMKQAVTYGIYSARNELLASAVYFFSHRRSYYILVGNHPNGKTLGASHYLIDRFIADYSGRELLLDFEGSDIRNLAFFYSSFGATVETYPALQINRLPLWARLFKH